MAKRKNATHKLPLPTSEAEVNQYITALAEARIKAERLVTRTNERIALLKAEMAEALEQHDQEMQRYAVALFTYFERNKDELTDGGKRQSHVFATGVLGQRYTPPRTSIRNEERVKQYVVEHGLEDFYEEKVVLRRDVMLAQRSLAENIPGVRIVRDRVVYVRPDHFDLEIDLEKKVEAA